MKKTARGRCPLTATPDPAEPRTSPPARRLDMKRACFNPIGRRANGNGPMEKTRRRRRRRTRAREHDRHTRVRRDAPEVFLYAPGGVGRWKLTDVLKRDAHPTRPTGRCLMMSGGGERRKNKTNNFFFRRTSRVFVNDRRVETSVERVR